MSTTTSARGAFERGLAQWPIVAGAGAIHLGLLLYVYFSRFPSGGFGLIEKLFIPLGLIGLVCVEVALLVLALAALEIASPRGKVAAILDLAKSAALAGIVTLLSASTLKFMATSVHLRRTDIWFATANLRQILQEAQPSEVFGLVGLPIGALVLTSLLWIGFRRWRGSGRALPVRRFLIFAGAAALLLIVANSVSSVLPQILDGVVPETHWVKVRRSHSRFMAAGVAPPIGTSARTIEAYLPQAPQVRNVPNTPQPSKQPMNVVVVMLESVPWKRTSLAAEGRPGVTPHLERLADESAVFERAYAVSTHSDYAQMGILSSLHPRKYPKHDYYVDLEYPRTLIWDALAPAGYATSMFSCQNERWGNMLNFLDTPGLDLIRHSLSWPNAPKKGSGAESKVYEDTVVEEWKRWRKSRGDGPYLSYLNFQSNHFPYEVPGGTPQPYQPAEIDFGASFIRYPIDRVPVMLNRFDNALRYADQKIGEVVEFLKEVGDWDSTILVVVSDHGEAFYEHDQPTHGTALYEEQVRSLWLMRVPGQAARRVSEPVTLLDVSPTVLTALGLPPHGNFQGRGDVLSTDYNGRERALFFTIQGLTLEDGVLLGDTKLIVNWDRQTKALFDLAADPEELVDLSQERPDRLGAMEQVLGAFLQQQLGYYEQELWNQGYYPAALP